MSIKNKIDFSGLGILFHRGMVWLNARNNRERFILFFGSIIGVTLLWNGAFYRPLQASIKKRHAEIAELREQIEKIDAETNNVMVILEKTQETGSGEQVTRDSLLEQVKRLDEALGGVKADFVSPQQMIMALRTMLERQSGLQLVRLDTATKEAAELKNAADKNSVATTIPGFYEHNITIVLQGDYFSLLQYLRSLDALGWRLFWDKLDYKVITYPQAEITLKLHTLSAEKGFGGG
jgi:MSHA biogenesis protein MshJ